ncbi:MAG: hypothetical protein JRJ03_10440 [Deltaproteobacteria bacterium]|nr:hypothetical protein [Deltaproteobacteria bacterium]
MKPELSDEDIQYIRDVFFRDVVPKLKKAQAWRGTISCEFAGERYKHWSLRFASRGSDFDIEEFEYDEGSSGLDLDL